MVKIQLQSEEFTVKQWLPRDGMVGKHFALSVKTTALQEGEFPDFIIGYVYVGSGPVKMIARQDLKAFTELHSSAYWVTSDSSVHLHSIEKCSGISLGGMIEHRKILDLSLLYPLVCLAESGDLPDDCSLVELSKVYLDYSLSTSCKTEGDLFEVDLEVYRDQDDSVNLKAIPERVITQGATESVLTWKIQKPLLDEAYGYTTREKLLSYDIQLKAAYALAAVERNGFYIDRDRVKTLKSEIQIKLATVTSRLQSEGWEPGGGSQATFERIAGNLETKYKFSLPRTRTGRLSTAEHDIIEHSHIPFFKDYLEYHSLKKFDSTFLNKLIDRSKLYPHFNVLVSTGRTSSYEPNFQNFPKDGGVRECLIPSSGSLFIIADYSTLELCCLAQICISRYRYSRMADLINQGIDLHKWFASQVTNKPMEKVTKEERTAAKACNFGFPGGFSVKNFLSFAQSTYGVKEMTLEQAEVLRNKWLAAFPEMKKYLSSVKDGQAVETLTGRIRANSSYTQALNTPFQGLGADGNKLAIYQLIKSGYRVVNTIHDEVVVEVSEAHANEDAETVATIMIREMRKVTPDVAIAVSKMVAKSWLKS